MRYSLLSSLEKVLPQLASPATFSVPEMPSFPVAKETARAFYDFHRKIGAMTSKYNERVKNVRSVIALMNTLDELIMAPEAELSDNNFFEDGQASDDDLRKLLSIFDAVISSHGFDNEAYLKAIGKVAEPFARITRLFKTVKNPIVQDVAADLRAWINSMISAVEAERDLMLAMKVARSRIEMELDTQRKTADSDDDLKSFLESCWR